MLIVAPVRLLVKTQADGKPNMPANSCGMGILLIQTVVQAMPWLQSLSLFNW